jgi:FkbM family methyltransferase
MSGALSGIGKYLDGLGLAYYFFCIMSGKFSDAYLDCTKDDIKKITDNREKIELTRSVLADSRSLEIYDSLLVARTSDDPVKRFSLLCEIVTDDQYFPDQIPFFSLSRDEIFVDAGACRGDSIVNFIKRSDGNYGHIHSFEPDPANFAHLKKLASNYQNVTCYNKGLYSTEKTLKFVGGAGGSSAIKDVVDTYGINRDLLIQRTGSTTESMKIEVCSIDNTINSHVTFIKMDIEGSELEALKGASQKLVKYKPKLAICIYHKIEDFWEIPLFIHNLVPEYQLFIGQHVVTWSCSETVLYAAVNGDRVRT